MMLHSLCGQVRGDVKLFDFGLAAVMPPNGDPYEDHFVMSGAGEKGGGGMPTLGKTELAVCRYLAFSRT
jgi:hypothetical protein